jgi:hypothetical protein
MRTTVRGIFTAMTVSEFSFTAIIKNTSPDLVFFYCRDMRAL